MSPHEVRPADWSSPWWCPLLRYYLAADTNIPCRMDMEWGTYTIIGGIPSLIIFVMGVPVFFFYSIRYARNYGVEHLADDIRREKYMTGRSMIKAKLLKECKVPHALLCVCSCAAMSCCAAVLTVCFLCVECVSCAFFFTVPAHRLGCLLCIIPGLLCVNPPRFCRCC